MTRGPMLARMKIGTTVGLGFALAALASIAVACAAWFALAADERSVTALSERALPSEQALAKVDRAMADTMRSVNALFVGRLSYEVWKAAWGRLGQCVSALHEGRKEFESIPTGPETRVAWQGVADQTDRWETEFTSLLNKVKRRDGLMVGGRDYKSPEVQQAEDEAWQQYEITRDTMKSLDGSFVKVRAALKKEADHEIANSRATSTHSSRLLLFVLVLSSGALVLFAASLTRHVRRVIATMVTESRAMSAAVRAGELEVRGHAEKVHPDFRDIIAGMNETVEAFVAPIQVTASYIDRMAKGDIPPKITDVYEGEFNRIKDNLNACIEAVQRLAEEAIGLSEAAVQGKLGTRADASKHQGDYRRIVKGVNDCLDAVTGPIAEAARVLEKLAERDLTARVNGEYLGDHEKMKKAVNATASALGEAIAQVAQSAAQVSDAAGQIASSSEAVAAGASQQASSLEETSSSLESIASSARKAADSAEQANTLAEQASTAATQGATAMQQMTGAMEKIKASAEGTSQIIKNI
ncbi:MAG TPA: hypothetical protein VLV17_01270, partial [Anaeromyxobacteraceae bacterium]|nr:hypothetical protein [Anaeromyxobacteraceae bacterium]